MNFYYLRRKFWNYVMLTLLAVSAGVAVAPLVSVFVYVVQRGIPAMNLAFFTQLPQPVGTPGGGVGHALLGTIILILMGGLLGIPWGLATGIYLSEYSRGRIATWLRFTIDLMASIPSIVVGLFIYAVAVRPFHGFSAYAGALALAFIMIPVVAKSTEEILKLVPGTLREAGLALGLPRWKVIIRIVLRGSIGSVFTGIILAIARVAGETAPLLFTAFGNRMWPHHLNEPIASLPVMIYNYAISPFEEWHQQAWAAACVLVIFVFSINLVTRWILKLRHG